MANVTLVYSVYSKIKSEICLIIVHSSINDSYSFVSNVKRFQDNAFLIIYCA